MTQTGSTGLISAAPRSFTSLVCGGGREGAAAPLADTAMMGVLDALGKPRIAPPMPQIARTDKANNQNHGGADQPWHAQSKIAECVAGVD
jgi:hypothetical protein